MVSCNEWRRAARRVPEALVEVHRKIAAAPTPTRPFQIRPIVCAGAAAVEDDVVNAAELPEAEPVAKVDAEVAD